MYNTNSTITIYITVATADSPLGKFNEIISQAKIAASSTEKATFWRRRRKLNQDLEVFQYFGYVIYTI